MMRGYVLLFVLPAVVSCLLLTTPRKADAAHGGRGGRGGLVYTSPANILRGQRALEKLGKLERGKYEAGEYDEPTIRAIRIFQSDRALRVTGSFDWDTFAILPVDERPDKDNDGVPDAEDKCPDTPAKGPKGAWVRVGQDGCPIEAKK